MNILLPEINDNPNKVKAAPSYNVAVQNEINNSVKNIVKKHFNDENIDEKLFEEKIINLMVMIFYLNNL